MSSLLVRMPSLSSRDIVTSCPKSSLSSRDIVTSCPDVVSSRPEISSLLVSDASVGFVFVDLIQTGRQPPHFLRARRRSLIANRGAPLQLVVGFGFAFHPFPPFGRIRCLRRHCCTCSITARQTFYVRRSIRTKPPYGNMIGADPPALLYGK